MTQTDIVSKTPTTPTRKRSIEWPMFQKNLATALKSMQEDEHLIISEKRANRFVQFAASGGFGIRMETTSNAYLGKTESHSERIHLALLALGWKPPTDTPAKSTPEDDPDGSPNYYIDFPEGTSQRCIATLAVRTLADLYEISHPGNLEYDAFDSEGTTIEYKILKIQSIAERKKRVRNPARRLLKSVMAATGIKDLEYDDDEHLHVVYGDLNVFIILDENASCVRIISALFSEITTSNELLGVINTLNAEPNALRFFVHEECVIAMYIIPAKPIIDSHVGKALEDFGRHALEASPRLAAVLLNTAETTLPVSQAVH